MAELAHLLESLGIEVVLIGLVVLLFLALARVIWKSRHCSVSQGLLEDRETVKPLFEKGKLFWVVLAAALVVASQLGTIFVLISDEVLDSNKLIKCPLFLYVPALSDIVGLNFSGKWDEEDQLKLIVLEDESERTDFTPKIKCVLKSHLPQEKGGRCPNDIKYDCAKGFFQHANAVVISNRGGDIQRDELRHEKHVVRLLAVIFVGIWILIATLVWPFIIGVIALFTKNRRYDLFVRAVFVSHDPLDS